VNKWIFLIIYKNKLQKLKFNLGFDELSSFDIGKINREKGNWVLI